MAMIPSGVLEVVRSSSLTGTRNPTAVSEVYLGRYVGASGVVSNILISDWRAYSRVIAEREAIAIVQSSYETLLTPERLYFFAPSQVGAGLIGYWGIRA